MASPADPPLPKRLCPTHIKDDAFAKILQENGFQEFLTEKKKWVRARWLVRAIGSDQPLPPVISTYIKNHYAQWFTPESVQDLKGEGRYVLQQKQVNNDTWTEQVEARETPLTPEEEEEVQSKAKATAATTSAGGGGAGKQSAPNASDDSESEAEEDKSGDNPSDIPSGFMTDARNAGGRRRRARTDDPNPGNTADSGLLVAEDYDARRNKRPRFTLEDIYATGNAPIVLDNQNKAAYPTTWSKFMLADNVEFDPKNPARLPAALLTKELFEAVDLIMEVNGGKCHDAEAVALGAIKKAEYMLMPDTCKPDECEAVNVLRGRNAFKPELVILAQIYALARDQAKQLGMKDDDAHKWAILRNQSFAAGWYCRQSTTRFKTPPKDSIKTYLNALVAHKEDIGIAFRLAGFIPFFLEMTFRSQCSTWSQTRANEFETKAKKLAMSSGYEEELKFAEGKLLFGSVFRWIGVERVKDVLQADLVDGTIPRIFELRLESAPAGMAFICNCARVIQIIKGNGWWERIKEEGGYEDNNIIELSKKLIAEPFKYHMMSGAYGIEKLSLREQEEVREAKQEGEKLAPALHAYTNTFMAGKPLAQNKTIEKYANNAGAIYESFRRLFLSSRGKRVDHLTDVFRKDMFGKLPDPPAGAPRAPRRRRGRNAAEPHEDDEPDYELLL